MNDDAASLFALESVLMDADRQPDFELVTATSGQEALRRVLTDEFAVILLDIHMPGMDGFETAEAIHSHPRSASVPIIFITALYADEMHRLKGYQKGAADYLLTPVIPQVLQTKVGVFVDLTRKNLELQAKTEELARLNQALRVQRRADLERINRELEQEVAERKLAEERANALAVRDPLTQLVNRRALIQQLEHAVAYADRHQNEFALLFLDLDHFKAINDHHGHELGDELLRQVAARLLAAVRVSDVVARLGGDEFVVLLEGRGAAANAVRVARKIEQAHAHVFEVGGQRIPASTSIGIALYPQDAAGASQLMKNADTAMYHAKQRRRGSIEFFREELNAREAERREQREALSAALAKGQFELLFQPKAALPGRSLCGLEALLHWRRADGQLVAAAEFLHDLGDDSLLARISDWTINEACRQLAMWRGSKVQLPQLTLSVDLPLLQAQGGQAERILERVAKHALAPGELALEIPEYLLAGDRGAPAPLRQLHAGGVGLSVDDFGSAGAALAALKELPLDTLKVDAAFVEAIGSEGGTDMAAAIVHLGRALGMRVLAQGVESEAQLKLLSGFGCDQYQGPLFSSPLKAAALLPLLAQTGPQDLIMSRNSNQASPSTPKQRGTSR